jgi:hypothetical protein
MLLLLLIGLAGFLIFLLLRRAFRARDTGIPPNGGRRLEQILAGLLRNPSSLLQISWADQTNQM